MGLTLKDYVENDIGISGRKRVFYPRKPRSCKQCHHHDYDPYSFKSKGCSAGFRVDNDRAAPLEKCYPVMDDSNMAESHAYAVRVKILTMRKNEEDHN